MPEDLKGIKSFSWTKILFSDVTIIVYDESLPDKSMTFDCRKDIISRQIKIFNAGHTTVESSSGEVQITDVSVMINSDLMIAANNYNVEILVSNCVSRSRGRKI